MNFKRKLKISFFQSDVSYMILDAKDEMVHWNSFRKKRLRKYYLTMYIREAYAVFNETKKVEMDSSFGFSKLWPQNNLLITPCDQCKCVTHEILFLNYMRCITPIKKIWGRNMWCVREQAVLTIWMQFIESYKYQVNPSKGFSR